MAFSDLLASAIFAGIDYAGSNRAASTANDAQQAALNLEGQRLNTGADAADAYQRAVTDYVTNAQGMGTLDPNEVDRIQTILNEQYQNNINNQLDYERSKLMAQLYDNQGTPASTLGVKSAADFAERGAGLRSDAYLKSFNDTLGLLQNERNLRNADLQEIGAQITTPTAFRTGAIDAITPYLQKRESTTASTAAKASQEFGSSLQDLIGNATGYVTTNDWMNRIFGNNNQGQPLTATTGTGTI